MNAKKQSSREIFPDVLRIFAALLVILLHVQAEYFNAASNFGKPLWWIVVYCNELTRVGVPIFFMLSGYLLLSANSCENIPAFYKKRFSKLVLPFLCVSVIYYLFYRLAADQPLFDMAFIDQLLNTGTAYHLWYLYSLAMLYLFIPFMKMAVKYSEDAKKPWILILFLVLLTWQTTLKPALNTACGGKLYFYLAPDGAVGYFGYALLGYLLGKYEITKKLRTVIFVLGGVSFVVFPILLGNSIIESRDWFWNGGYTINHYLEAAAVFLAAKMLFRGDFGAKHKKTASVLSYLSSLTFHVYLIHVLMLEFTAMFLSPLLDRMTPSVSMIFTMTVVTLLSFSLSAAWKKIFSASGTSASNIR